MASSTRAQLVIRVYLVLDGFMLWVTKSRETISFPFQQHVYLHVIFYFQKSVSYFSATNLRIQWYKLNIPMPKHVMKMYMDIYYVDLYFIYTQFKMLVGWVTHYARSWKIAGSISDVIGSSFHFI